MSTLQTILIAGCLCFLYGCNAPQDSIERLEATNTDAQDNSPDRTTIGGDDTDTDHPSYTADGAFAAPDGSGSECTMVAPCSRQTAMDKADTIILLDGIYKVPETWYVPSGKLVVAYRKWAARVDFTSARYIQFDVSGEIRNLEITAPASYTAVELQSGAIADGLLIHDANTDDSYDYSTWKGCGTSGPQCVCQGTIDSHSNAKVINTVLYRTGIREGAEGCSVYHPIYFTSNNVIHNNLIVQTRGGWGIHAWQSSSTNNDISGNTIIGVEGHQGIITYGNASNVIKNNVITQSSGCIRIYAGGSINASNNICKLPNSTKGVGVTTEGDISPAEVSYATIIAEFDAATTSIEKIKVAKKYSMDHTKTNGAGYVYTD
jgi:copper-binding protein NosD